MSHRMLTLICLSVLAAGAVASDAAAFSLSSTDLVPRRSVPNKFVFNDVGCSGGNRSPSLAWRGVPQGTKSFAITMYDLDERASLSGWWHWVVYNLPPTVKTIGENAGSATEHNLPRGTVQGRTDLGNDGYHGPCPGKGEPAHRYLITIYALRVAELPVPAEASGAMVSLTAREYTLAKATLTAAYGR